MNSGNELIPIADRINVEPPIINGMSQSEVIFIAGASFVFFFGVGLMFALATGIWPLLIGSALAGPLVSVWMLSQHLAVLKRNRPDGYHIQVVRRWFTRRLGFPKKVFIEYSGYWSLGRDW